MNTQRGKDFIVTNQNQYLKEMIEASQATTMENLIKELDVSGRKGSKKSTGSVKDFHLTLNT